MMINRSRSYVLLAEAGEGAGAGGGAAGDAGAGATGGTGAGATGATGADPTGSVLATGAAGTGGGAAATGTAATGGAVDPFAFVPEKFRVLKDDKTLDLEASARKVEEHRSHLEKRLGAGDIPPKTAEEYKINVPEKLAATFKADELAKDPMMVQFMKDAHAAGMTQKQIDFAIGGYLERAPQLAGQLQELKAADCTTQLKADWKTDEDFSKNVQAAYKAGEAYAGKDFEGILKDYGNDPRVIRMLANVGKELGEDTSASAEANTSTAEDIAALQKSKAYWDPKDPTHEIVKGKVAAHYNAMHGQGAKKTGAQTFEM